MDNDATLPADQDPGPLYHGTEADLKAGDALRPGYRSNFGGRRPANLVYLTATLDAATWGAELSVGEGPGRIYRVEPTGPIEHDPNLTDKKFPGNPTRSYRTRQPLRVVEEIAGWEPHPPEMLQGTRDRLEELKGSASQQSTTEGSRNDKAMSARAHGREEVAPPQARASVIDV